MDDLDALISKLDKIGIVFKSERRELVENVGELMHSTLIKNIDATTSKTTGAFSPLRNGQKKVLGSGGGFAVVRPDYKIAPYTHLVENGHKARGDGFVNGKHFYLKTFAEVEPIAKQKAQDMMEKIAGEF